MPSGPIDLDEFRDRETGGGRALTAEEKRAMDAAARHARSLSSSYPTNSEGAQKMSLRDEAILQATNEYDAQIAMMEKRGVTREEYVESRLITLLENGEIGHATQIANRAKVRKANAATAK
jgi:hypothetical protein